MSVRLEAPWTAEQVDRLNAYQQSGWGHPYTCRDRLDGNHVYREDGARDDFGVLVATPDGWVCRDCPYTQEWAHAFMAGEHDG